MKRLLILGAFALASVGMSESTVGIAYGTDMAVLTNHQTVAVYDYWVAGTQSGLLFGKFYFVDTGNGPGSYAVFVGSRLKSFKCYSDPFFGKVADFWVEGRYGQDPANGGRSALAHVRVTDSDFAGSPATFAYFAIDVSLPNAPNNSIFSRIGVTFNASHILCADNVGGQAGGQGVSDKGLAYSPPKGVVGITNRVEAAAALYKVAYNGLLQFAYQDAHLGFVGNRLHSFLCSNTGVFGEQAEFWMEGRAGDSIKTAGTNRVARVVITESNSPLAYDLLYIAVYHPANLNKPIYERLVFILAGKNTILCK